ncbi:hypothetical protein QQX98_004133 [Neonectria punicea]|uniref:Uncharacterized protein n=1 Tax=Neonectria punicea TaxID=979145 RepID=A0ABR1HBC3_9HYPO
MPSQAASHNRSRKKNKKKRLKKNGSQPRNPATDRFFWDLDFDPDSSLGLQAENEPFLSIWEATAPNESPVRFFMTESRAAKRVMPGVELVAQFCSDDNLEKLRSGNSPGMQEEVALMDDRTNNGVQSTPRDYLGPLSAHGLYLALKRKRFYVGEDTLGENSGGGLSQADLSPYTVMALISTASTSQANALRGSLYRHLAFKCYLNTTYPLAFDLPYYALRTAPRYRPPRDTRTIADNGPLRKVKDLSFLRRRSRDDAPILDVDYLCEAQTTVLVTGLGPWRWVAYCFTDTYFEHEDNREDVNFYHTAREVEDGHVLFQPDPFTAASTEASRPRLDAREYFVTVFKTRLDQKKDEWDGVVSNMRSRIHSYIEDCPIKIADIQSRNFDDPHVVRQARHTVVETRSLLRLLIQKLKETISKTNSFKSNEVFKTVPGRASEYVPEIQKSIQDLETSLDALQSLDKDCDAYNDGLSFHLNHEGTRDANIQARLASFNQVRQSSFSNNTA